MMRPDRCRPLRIVMTADAVGGVWPYALTLAAALGNSVEIHLAVLGPSPNEWQRRAAASLANLNLHLAEFQLEWMPDASRDFARSHEWLLRLADNCRPDIIHLNGYAHAAGAWSAPVIVVAHSCVLSWWQAVHGRAAPPEWRAYKMRVSAGLARSRRVVAPTRAMLRGLSRHYGVPIDGVVIHNGCALEYYDAAKMKKEDFVFSAGRLWDEGKNLAAVDAAAARLSVPVYVAGDCRHPGGRYVEPRAARALGQLRPDKLADWMARAAIYALPARYEPFGLSILEAAASRCALVLGDIPSLRELWDGAAVFVPPDDARGLAEAITELVQDRALRARRAAAAKRRALEYSAAQMGRRYLQLYRELAADGETTIPLMVAG